MMRGTLLGRERVPESPAPLPSTHEYFANAGRGGSNSRVDQSWIYHCPTKRKSHILLSMSSYSWEVSAKLRSLRDFFLISFFILLGTQMSFSSVSTQIKPIILYSLLILIGNPIIVMGLMGFFRYTKSTGFMAGLTVAQISEFSLILIALGAKVGHLSTDVLSLITAIGLITIAGSSYMII